MSLAESKLLVMIITIIKIILFSIKVCAPQPMLPQTSLHNIPGNSAFVQQNFRPQPESTFIPVEPAKDPQVNLKQ